MYKTYNIYVYRNEPYEFIEKFTLKSNSYMGLLVDAAKEVNLKYGKTARVGKVEIVNN